MLRPLVAFAGWLALASLADAQMVTIGTPFQTTRDSFFEGINTGWSLRGPNFFATFNGGGNAAGPPFGGFNPNAGIQSGFAFRSGPFTGELNFGAAQGGSRTMLSSTPMVTTMNGYPGFFTSSVQRPFVTSVVPIVGAGVVGYAPVVTGLDPPPMLAPLAPQLPWQMSLEAQGLPRRTKPDDVALRDRDEPAANAGRGDGDRGRDGLIDPLPPTRAERERQEAAEEQARNRAARDLFSKGLKAEEAGKETVARLYFEMAAKRATGPFKDEIEQRLRPPTRSP